MNTYAIMFILKDYACNAHELRVNRGETRVVYQIRAEKIYKAFEEAVRRVHRDYPSQLADLNFCMLKEHVLNPDVKTELEEFNGSDC